MPEPTPPTAIRLISPLLLVLLVGCAGQVNPPTPSTAVTPAPPSAGPSTTDAESIDAPSRNGWIAYGMNPEDGGDQDIWFVSLDGETRRVVGTESDRMDQLCPAFSPDGRRLAYGQVDRSGATPSMAVVVADVSAEGGVSEAFRVEVVGAPPCPIWSPTGDRIAFGVPQTSVINPTQSAAGQRGLDRDGGRRGHHRAARPAGDRPRVFARWQSPCHRQWERRGGEWKSAPRWPAPPV